MEPATGSTMTAAMVEASCNVTMRGSAAMPLSAGFAPPSMAGTIMEAGFSGSRAIAFGPDGNLYVAGANINSVLRFDGATGAFKDVFAAGNGMSGTVGLTFAPNGDLFVGALADTSLRRLSLDGEKVVGEETLLADMGLRIRDVEVGPDGMISVEIDTLAVKEIHGDQDHAFTITAEVTDGSEPIDFDLK